MCIWLIVLSLPTKPVCCFTLSYDLTLSCALTLLCGLTLSCVPTRFEAGGEESPAAFLFAEGLARRKRARDMRQVRGSRDAPGRCQGRGMRRSGDAAGRSREKQAAVPPHGCST